MSWLPGWLTDWLMQGRTDVCLPARLNDWQTNGLSVCLADWLTERLIDCLSVCLPCWLTGGWTDWLTDCLPARLNEWQADLWWTDELTDWLSLITDWLSDCQTDWLRNSQSDTTMHRNKRIIWMQLLFQQRYAKKEVLEVIRNTRESIQFLRSQLYTTENKDSEESEWYLFKTHSIDIFTEVYNRGL